MPLFRPLAPWPQHRAPGVIAVIMWSILMRLAEALGGWSHGLTTPPPPSGTTDDTISGLGQQTFELFYHGYDNYMNHAFPEDELHPIDCSPLARDRDNPAHIEVNDMLGNYSLTLVDSLSTLAILASSPNETGGLNKALEDFQHGIALFVEYYGDGTDGPGGEGKRARGFDLDSKVQVFETVIRGVGGLLSAHLFAVGDLPITGYRPIEERVGNRAGILWHDDFLYDGQLLRLAQDLAERLLPAFHTPTNIPYPRVNLRHGIPFYENSPLNMDAEHGQCRTDASGPKERTDTCSAGAGSLVLEFTTLSRLTNDGRFEKAAKNAFFAVWRQRSSYDLIGNAIDAESGQWVTPDTGIGAGIDSFFEYAFKSHVLLSGTSTDWDDPSQSSEAFLAVWLDVLGGIQSQVRKDSGFRHPFYGQVHMHTGAVRYPWIDSLSAYFPGLLALAGEVNSAIESHLLFTALWSRYGALPERWEYNTQAITFPWWGGRPEFIESTWYLYRATQDPWYLYVGKMALRDIQRRCKTHCGWAGLEDVRTGQQKDRMESFFLGETAKYLFLLFNPSHPLNALDLPIVFTTEGHPLIIPKRLRHLGTARNKTLTQDLHSDAMCPLPPAPIPLSISATAAREDVYHAAYFAGLPEHYTEQPTFESSNVLLSQAYSPSNYTYFPWTLPSNLIPANATCSKTDDARIHEITFPYKPDAPVGPVVFRRGPDGIFLDSVSGLRFSMFLESTGLPKDAGNAAYNLRIASVSNVPLGRDENVFVASSAVSAFSPTEDLFRRKRDLQALDLVLDVSLTEQDRFRAKFQDNIRIAGYEGEEVIVEIASDGGQNSKSRSNGNTSETGALLDKILNQLLEIPKSLPQDLQDWFDSAMHQSNDDFVPNLERIELAAAIAIGPGAAPIPDMDEPPALDILDEDSPLPYQTLYISDETCSGKLPAAVARENQVLVIKRGDCSFSQKLRNIPAVPPVSASLQLVIVVSNPEAEVDDGDGLGVIQPMLEEPQFIMDGIPRPHPIPMVMVQGGEETIGLLAKARGVGFRRRIFYESQGKRIVNLIVH